MLVEATGSEPSVASAPLVVACTSTFWRNAWKYEARAYRHSFWDGGTVLANLLAVSRAAGLPASVVLGFADAPVNRLLGVDPDREAAIALAAIGQDGAGAGRGSVPDLPALHLPTVPISRREVRYQEIREVHTASSLGSGKEAAAWRGLPPASRVPPPTPALTSFGPLAHAELPPDPVEVVIRRRGSTRRFAREPIGVRELSTILARSMRGVPADCVDAVGRPLADPYLIVNAVDGLTPGKYFMRPDPPSFELLEAGLFRAAASRLALGQELAADASADLYLLTELEPLLDRFGDRGYRAAQLTSAIAGGWAWLAAYALGFGATGLTFFDDEVTEAFSPHAAGKSVMFLLALGRRRH